MSSNTLFKKLLDITGKQLTDAFKEYRPDLRKSIGAVDDKRIYANAVTTAKIADSAVTVAKLSFDPATQSELDTHSATIASPTVLGHIKVGTGLSIDGSGVLSNSLDLFNRQLSWYEDGTISTGTSKGPLRRLDVAVSLMSAYAYLKTAPTGAAILVDILKASSPNGSYTSILSSPISISASAFVGSTTSFAVATLSAGDYLRMDITQIGSTVAGASLTVDLNCTGASI